MRRCREAVSAGVLVHSGWAPGYTAAVPLESWRTSSVCKCWRELWAAGAEHWRDCTVPGNGELTWSVSLACKQHRKQGEKTPLPLVFSYHPLVTSLNIVPADRREIFTESNTVIMEQAKRNLELRDDESVINQIPLRETIANPTDPSLKPYQICLMILYPGK